MMSVTRATYPSRLTALDTIKVSKTSTAAQLINKFRVFCGTRQNSTTFTRAPVTCLGNPIHGLPVFTIFYYISDGKCLLKFCEESFLLISSCFTSMYSFITLPIQTAKLHLHPSNGTFEQRLIYTSVIWCKLHDSMLTE